MEICQAVRTELVAAELADCAGDDGCWLRGGECVVVLILLCNASGEAVTYLGNIEWSDSTRSQFVLLRGAACSCVTWRHCAAPCSRFAPASLVGQEVELIRLI